MIAALEYFGRYRVDARSTAELACRWRVHVARARTPPATPPGWELAAEIKRPTDRDETTWVYRRTAP